MRLLSLFAAITLAAPAWADAQTTAGPTQPELDLAVRRGGIATIAALCGMRDDAWAEDLRKGAVQDATHAQSPNDRSLAAAPGANLATSALGFADVEATEDFAEATPKIACQKLAADPGLVAADRRVALYRADLNRMKPGT